MAIERGFVSIFSSSVLIARGVKLLAGYASTVATLPPRAAIFDEKSSRYTQSRAHIYHPEHENNLTTIHGHRHSVLPNLLEARVA